MHPPRIGNGLASQLASLSLRVSSHAFSNAPVRPCQLKSTIRKAIHTPLLRRSFTTTPTRYSWLIPKSGEKWKSRKGRPRVRTGGSTSGTTVVWGDYGIRMTDKGRRISAAHLKIGEDTIRKRLRGLQFRLYARVCANIGVYTSGNDQRMGKGKGSFDYWATRVAVSRVVFELSGNVHEQIVRDAFRLAGNKLPGMYEFVKKGDPPVMGITKLGNGVTAEDLLRPRRKLPALEPTGITVPENGLSPAVAAAA